MIALVGDVFAWLVGAFGPWVFIYLTERGPAGPRAGFRHTFGLPWVVPVCVVIYVGAGIHGWFTGESIVDLTKYALGTACYLWLWWRSRTGWPPLREQGRTRDDHERLP